MPGLLRLALIICALVSCLNASARLAAQLARTEEAAKRALVQTDATAKGGAAQKLLDAERGLQKLREENAVLKSNLAR